MTVEALAALAIILALPPAVWSWRRYWKVYR